MARIKEGPTISGIRGSVAGATFSSGRYGAYLRQKVSPTQPGTGRQNAQRLILTKWSQAWRNLEPEVMAAWQAWAANHPIVDVFGNAQVLAGNAAFVKVQAFVETIGKAELALPPTDPVTVQPGMESMEYDGATGVMTITLTEAATGSDVYAVFSTQGLSPGRAFVSSAFRYSGAPLALTPFTSLVLTPTDVNPLLIAANGQKVGCMLIRCTSQGWMIDKAQASCIAATPGP